MNRISKFKQAETINRLWFFAGLAVFLLLFFGLTKEIVNRRLINRQISDYQDKIAELQLENSVLDDKISNWNASGELEKNVRAKLGLEKPGEQTIIISRNDSKSAEATAVKSNQEEVNLAINESVDDNKSNVAKWWNYFFN